MKKTLLILIICLSLIGIGRVVQNTSAHKSIKIVYFVDTVNLPTITVETTIVTEPIPTTIIPGSPQDPWGPILCPGIPHPAHHKPCREEKVLQKTTESKNDSSSGGVSDTDVAGCIRKYESGGTTDTNGSNDDRDGYYQIIPSTWGNYDGYSTAQEAPRSVQDERFNQLWAEGGHHHWAAQSGRCF